MTFVIPYCLTQKIASRTMVRNEMDFINKADWLLVIIGGGIFALALWMTIEALIAFFNPARTAEPGRKLDVSA
jgi:hypothetical protein